MQGHIFDHNITILKGFPTENYAGESSHDSLSWNKAAEGWGGGDSLCWSYPTGNQIKDSSLRSFLM